MDIVIFAIQKKANTEDELSSADLPFYKLLYEPAIRAFH